MYFRPESHNRHGDSSTRDHSQGTEEECSSLNDYYLTQPARNPRMGLGYFPNRCLVEAEKVEEHICFNGNTHVHSQEPVPSTLLKEPRYARGAML